MTDLPEFALSIRQPWAWLIAMGFKDIENRDWPTRYRGPVLIHAGKTWGRAEKEAHAELEEGFNPCDLAPLDLIIAVPHKFQLGGIVGVVDIVDCVDHHNSRWFTGPYGFVLRNARPIAFREVGGALGFFRPGVDHGREGQIR